MNETNHYFCRMELLKNITPDMIREKLVMELSDSDFRILPPINEYQIDRRYAYKKEIEFYRWRVAYGYRLRIGDIENVGYSYVDICSGDSLINYDLAFLFYILMVKENFRLDRHPFHGIPEQTRIKPYFNDPDFMELLTDYLPQYFNNYG